MKSKALIILLSLGAASGALANGQISTPVVTPNYFDGFVVGATGGVAHEIGRVKHTAADAVFDLDEQGQVITSEFGVFSTSLENYVGSTDLDGGIFAGYGKTLNSNFYLGAEIFARYAHAKPETKTSHDQFEVNPLSSIPLANLSQSYVKVDSDFSYGGALKGGYLITPKTMFYVLAGIEYTKFNVNVGHMFIGTDEHIINNDAILTHPFVVNNYSFSKGKVAFMPGVGLETMLTDNFSLKAEYTYACYGDLSKTNSTQNVLPNETVISSEGIPVVLTGDALASAADTKVSHLSRGLFTLGLSYHFNGV